MKYSVIPNLDRISHKHSTEQPQYHALTALRSIGVLNVLKVRLGAQIFAHLVIRILAVPGYELARNTG